jgi:hypothetical protein
VGLLCAWIRGLTIQFYHYTHDLWQDAENLWEGGFCLIASVLYVQLNNLLPIHS